MPTPPPKFIIESPEDLAAAEAAAQAYRQQAATEAAEAAKGRVQPLIDLFATDAYKTVKQALSDASTPQMQVETNVGVHLTALLPIMQRLEDGVASVTNAANQPIPPTTGTPQA